MAPEGFAQLILTLMMCSLVCFVLLAIVFGEAQQIKRARVEVQFQATSGQRSSAGERSIVGAGVVSPGQTGKGNTSRRLKRPSRLLAQYEELRHMGFSKAQINRLVTYRAAYRTGHYQPDPLLPGRLKFARWLYEHSKITDEEPRAI